MKQEYLRTALDSAEAGGAILSKYWGQLQQVQQKEHTGDLVTEADNESEKEILSMIRKNHPEHEILAEESGKSSQEDSDHLWVVDPLDGTTNYTHQYPFVAVSIALLEKGKPIVAVVSNPILQELYYAVEGEGAYFNNNRLEVSTTEELGKSLLATGFPYDRRVVSDTNYPEFCHLTHMTQGVRRGGSAALDLAFVAAGRLDGFWERGLKPWDMAAGQLLVEEAGGLVSDYDMGPFDLYRGRILASNGKIHDLLSRELLMP